MLRKLEPAAWGASWCDGSENEGQVAEVTAIGCVCIGENSYMFYLFIAHDFA